METHDLKFRRGITTGKRNKIRDQYLKLVNSRKKQFEKLYKPVMQLAKRFNKELKPVVLRKDEKTLAELRTKTRREIGLALLKDRNPVIHDAEKIKSALTRFKAHFRKEIKNHAALLAIKRRYNGEVRKEFENIQSAFTVLDDLVIADLPTLEIDPAFGAIFKPPYDFSEENDINAGFASVSVPQIDLQSGFISYRFFMEHEAPNWFNDPRGISAYVGVGVSFIMPRAGVLKVTLTMQSTLARLRARITDNFGWSDGNVQISAGVYMNVLHPNNVSVNELMMTNLNLSTGGDDVQSFINNLPSEIPYMIALTSTGAFAAGETLQIIVGTVVKATSRVDDMTSELSATVSWQVKRVFVQVI